jgi:2-polyprenyl-3-methyl-5-hydroxy-6-metoxy-1,4-benzoquinol methylase
MADELLGRGSFSVVRCRGCGLLRTEDELDGEALAAYYDYPGGRDAGARLRPVLGRLSERLRRRRARLVTRLRREPGRILDVGCGRPAMLIRLAELGWEVWGSELDEGTAATARARLPGRVLTGALDALELPEACFDVVTFFHVLEHLPDPRLALDRAAALLEPGGAVVVAVPNHDSWQAAWAGRRWLHLDVPRHRTHFSVATLRALAARSGLMVERVHHFSFELGAFGMLETLLGITGRGLYAGMLRRVGGDRRRARRRLLLWPLLPVLGGVALVLEGGAAAARRGGCITAVLRRAPV